MLYLLAVPVLIPASPDALFAAFVPWLLKPLAPALCGFCDMLYIVIYCWRNFCMDCWCALLAWLARLAASAGLLGAPLPERMLYLTEPLDAFELPRSAPPVALLLKFCRWSYS